MSNSEYLTYVLKDVKGKTFVKYMFYAMHEIHVFGLVVNFCFFEHLSKGFYCITELEDKWCGNGITIQIYYKILQIILSSECKKM